MKDIRIPPRTHKKDFIADVSDEAVLRRKGQDKAPPTIKPSELGRRFDGPDPAHTRILLSGAGKISPRVPKS